MRQALSRFASSLRQRFSVSAPQLEKRLTLISAFFGTWVITWLIPKVVYAMPDGNTRADAAGTGTTGGALAASAPSGSAIMGAMADGASYIFNFVATVIAGLLYIVVYALIFVNTLITDLVIRVAQYNNFVGARPVVLGWPLVRDVCNMFFIVVLLLIAFSTIIGYKPFHFKDNLPRLLLYAVLINFSKTLIGLLIDFSQVITLTFVAGFKDAAFGNFAKAFQVPSLMQLGGQATSGGAGLPTTSNIIVALIFGIFIMSIAMTTLVIMLIYFIARIVGLWVLLILSPLAFFALGVPGKIQSALSPVSSFWKQLSAWLTGGPVVAFFLWLALAVIQSSDSPFKDVGGVGTNSQEEAAVQAVITDIGKPENVLNFVVSIAFMLIGVKTAVEVSQQANPYLGKLASDLKSGGGVAWKTAKAIPQAPRAAAKAASYIPGSKFVAQKINAKAAQGGVGGSLARLSGAGSMSAMVLSEGGKREDKRLKDQTKKLDESLAGMGTEDKMNRLKAIRREAQITPNDAARYQAADQQLSKLIMSKQGARSIENGVEASLKGTGVSPGEIEARKSLAVKKERKEQLDASETLAKKNGDDATIDFINEERKKDPGLMSYEKMGTEAGSFDPKTIKAEAWGDSAVFLAFAKDRGLIDDKTGKMKTGYEDSADWKAISSGSGNAAKFVKSHVERLDTAAGRTDALSVLAAMQPGADQTARDAADQARMALRMDKNNQDVLGVRWAPNAAGSHSYTSASGAELVGAPRQIKTFGDLTGKLAPTDAAAVRTAIGGTAKSQDEFAGNFTSSMNAGQARAVIAAQPAIAAAASGGPFTPDHLDQMYAAQGAGVSMGAIGAYKDDGSAVTANTSAAIDQLFARAFADAGSGVSDQKIQAAQFMANIDLSALKTGGAPAEKITTAYAASLAAPGGVDNFKTAFNAASGKQQQAIETRIREIISAAEKGRGKALGSRSTYETQAINFQDQLSSSTDKEMKRLARGEKKKK